MRTVTSLPRRGAAVALALSLGLGLAACGQSDDTADTSAAANDGGVPSINKAGLEPSGAVPTAAGGASSTGRGIRVDAVAGVVNVDGGFDTLTAETRRAYSETGSGTTVTGAVSGETRAFQRLCVGEIDIADSSRPITADEYEQCRLNGLDVVQFQVAADAVVLAIKAQTDVGADCLSTDQVKAGFQAGSTIDNWNQLGDNLDDVPFNAGGPTVEFNAARFFGRYVLENPEPVNSDFRVDYLATEDEDQTRNFVTGFESDENKIKVLGEIEPQYLDLREQLKKAWGYWATANDEVIEAVKQQRKGIRDERTPAARAKDDERVARAYTARSTEIVKINALKAQLKPIDERYQVADRSRRRLNSLIGHVGLFSQGFYSTYENRLRPFEIEIYDGDDEPNCIFPSPQTILNGEYPLSRQLLLTVTTRSLQRPEVQEFLKYYLDNSQVQAAAVGAVPMPNKDVERQIAWLNGDVETPKFGLVDGRFRELQDEDEVVAEEPPAAPPVQNPAR